MEIVDEMKEKKFSLILNITDLLKNAIVNMFYIHRHNRNVYGGNNIKTRKKNYKKLRWHDDDLMILYQTQITRKYD